MFTHDATEPVTTGEGPDDLASVIELPLVGVSAMSIPMTEPIAVPDDDEQVSTAPSFYQRNSGSLPKSGGGMSDAHRRTRLPTPENVDRGAVGDRLWRLFRR